MSNDLTGLGYKIVISIAEWMNRNHTEANYYVIQFFTWHGYFKAYLDKMQKVERQTYRYQNFAQNHFFHTFFKCLRWIEDREELEREVERLTGDTIFEMLSGIND